MMFRSLAFVGIWMLLTVSVNAQDIQRAVVKSVDAEQQSLTVTVDGKDQTLAVAGETQIRAADGGELKDDLKNPAFKVGADVFFLLRERNGKPFLVGLRPAGANAPQDAVGGNARANPGSQIQRGKIKAIDIEGRKLTLTMDGKDRALTLTDETRVLGSSADTLKERLKDFREGLETDFREVQRDGKSVVEGLRLVGPNAPGRGAGDAGSATPPPTDLRPLTELGADKYHGFVGGLYPEGQNARPKFHEDAGRRLASQVQPLDRDGQPAVDGRIVLLSIGMSNTSQASAGFRRVLENESGKNPRLTFVDGAQGAMTAFAIQDPNDGRTGTRYWTTVDERLKAAGVTAQQVQVLWIKQADAGPSSGFPAYARTLEGELAKIVQLLPKRFPNAKLCYLSSRTYGGYAKSRLNPEPYAYESGFAVKWLIERQIQGERDLNFDPAKGEVRAPWLSWGAYLWTNGAQKRADGMSFDAADFAQDGTHQSPSGQEKVGRLLLDFFKSDSTTKPWFLAPASAR